MSDRQSIGEILQEALEAIDDIGGSERHRLSQVIGRDAYDALISKPKGAHLVDRWISTTGKAKGPATKALALQIARVADRADLTDRIEREIGDAFDLPSPEGAHSPEGPERAPTKREVKNHAAAVNQKRNGQRVSYEKPNGVNIALLAKGNDLSKYIKARQNSRH